ncbi:unnamed protein product [Amoebophrya sp. A120]|nr:unnamed protein product [Amoebophrya sp. A120]|eukprot:GSA120T00013715001.1
MLNAVLELSLPQLLPELVQSRLLPDETTQGACCATFLEQEGEDEGNLGVVQGQDYTRKNSVLGEPLLQQGSPEGTPSKLLDENTSEYELEEEKKMNESCCEMKRSGSSPRRNPKRIPSGGWRTIKGPPLLPRRPLYLCDHDGFTVLTLFTPEVVPLFFQRRFC